MIKKQLKMKSGSITLELLIAFAILIINITVVMLLINGSQSISIDTETNNEALAKAQSLVEEARSFYNQDFYPGSVISTPTIENIYTKNLDVIEENSYTKKIIATINWTAEGGRNLFVKLITYLTNPIVISGGDTCDPVLSGDWSNPQLLGSADISSPEGATGLDVIAKKAYITTNPSSFDKPDLYIIDVSNPNLSNLPILGSIHTGPGLASVHVAGNYAYVANMSRTAQLQIIDISNSSSPFIAKSFQLNNVTGTGSQAIGNSIFYYNKKVYLGLTKTETGPEFNIIDVSNFLDDPTNDPVLIDSYQIGHNINDIYVKDNYVYIAHPSNIADPNPEQLTILNLTSMTRPPNGFYKAPDLEGHGKSIYMVDDTLYLGRTVTSSPNPEFYVLDNSNPDDLRVNNINPLSKKISDNVEAITVRDNLAFMLTSTPNLGFQIWDLNDLSNPTPYGSLNIQQVATGGFDCDGNTLYAAQRSSKALQIIGAGTMGDYSLSNSGNISVNQGSFGNNTITRTMISGTAKVTLSASGLPLGSTATFTNNPCNDTCSSQLTITTTLATPVGTYPITVTGTGGNTTTFELIVNAQSFDYELNKSFTDLIVNRGSFVTNTINVTKISGTLAQHVTLTFSGMQNGVSITTNPISGSCTPDTSCVVEVKLTAASNAQKITRAITVMGMSPAHSITFNLTVIQ